MFVKDTFERKKLVHLHKNLKENRRSNQETNAILQLNVLTNFASANLASQILLLQRSLTEKKNLI